MTFYFIRHGATRGNLEGRYVGSTDEPLLPESAAKLARLHLPPVERVYSSPMLRCRQSARLLYPGAPLEVAEDLRETDFGAFEYRNYGELKEWPEYRAWLESGGRAAFPGGEGREAFSLRVVGAFDRIAREAQNLESAAIVAHGGTIMALLEARALPRRDFYDYQVGPGRGFAAKWADGALKNLSSL